MKKYQFNSNNGEGSFFIVAEDKYQAYDNFINYLVNKSKEIDRSNETNEFNIYDALLFYWTNANILDPSTFPEGYTFDEIFVEK